MATIIEIILCVCLFLLGYFLGCIEENDLAILDLFELMEYAEKGFDMTAEEEAEIEQKYKKKADDYNNKHILRRIFKL